MTGGELVTAPDACAYARSAGRVPRRGGETRARLVAELQKGWLTGVRFKVPAETKVYRRPRYRTPRGRHSSASAPAGPLGQPQPDGTLVGLDPQQRAAAVDIQAVTPA